LYYRETITHRRLEGREDTGNLFGGFESLRRQPAASSFRHNFCKAVVGADRAANPWQSEFRNVFFTETEEQETTTIPCRDMGCHPVVLLPLQMRALL